ncbi:cytochrome P450 [Sphaerisporangium fuscum]|uniref:cytochrome P450 n=1 Tax=Sphaerisporangium fuscum TaxID=2835868 RepID=UPI001BDDA876|nr:cytochrome P450 [Sphaerisporangium fuscum]
MTTSPAPASPPAYPMARTCPYGLPPDLSRLREEEPITRVRLWDGSTPWLVTRYDDVRAVLADPRFSADAGRPGYPARGPSSRARRQGPGSFITMDPPEHTRHRRMLIREFTVRRTETLRPVVEETVERLLSGMAAGGQPVDLVQAFALPLPSTVICHLLGVPYADHAFFEEQSRRMLDLQGDPSAAADAARTLAAYLRDLVVAKAAAPGDDLIGRLVLRHVRTGELTLRETVATAMLLLVAGHETTANMIGLGVLTLLRHPEQAAEIRDADDPAVADAAVEELLRLLTVAHTGRRRVAVEDVELGGVTIRAGEGVIAAADAANRDPAVFAVPDELDIHRAPNHHVAFGFGVHQCLGQPLARLELRIAYRALFRRFPSLRLAVPDDRLSFLHTMPIYGVRSLPVTW